MQIRGSSVKSTMDFVQKRFSGEFEKWLASLPVRSRELFSQPIMVSEWYSAQDGMIIPTKVIAEHFYYGKVEKASYEIGRFSAEEGLTGLYKIFVKISRPSFVLSRSARIFSTYYSGVTFEVIESDSNQAVFEIIGLRSEEVLLLDRTIGWIDKALEIIGTKSVENKYSIIERDGERVKARIKTIWQ